MNEGADIPFVECLLFLRPTESKRIFLQQLGRGLRRYVGKSHCIVIDFIGNFKNAYKIAEYQDLLPYDYYVNPFALTRPKNFKEVLNLPLGCEVHFDRKVIELFAEQTLDPKFATRQNISIILIYQYAKTWRYLKRRPIKRDIDRHQLLHSDFYKSVFGSWREFEQVISAEFEKGYFE